MNEEFDLCTETPADRAERRRAVRHLCFTDLRVKCDATGQHIEIRPPDLSSQGMFINTSQVFPNGAALTISFRLGNSGRAVRLQGEVRYCLEGAGIGVEFTNVDEETRAAIERATRERGNDW